MAFKEIRAKNFKSLRDIKFPINQFNVLVGPNGSGKTNFIELFNFIMDCIRPTGVPQYPLLRWWGYDNVVWKRDETLPISFGFDLDIEKKYQVSYDATVSGQMGQFRYLSEKFEVNGIMKCIRDSGKIQLDYTEEYLSHVSKYPELFGQLPNQQLPSIDELKHQIIENFPLNRSILNWQGWGAHFSKDQKYALAYLHPMYPMDKTLYLISPATAEQMSGGMKRLKAQIFLQAQDLFSPNDIIILRTPNYVAIRQPSPRQPIMGLSEDGQGLTNTLYQWYNAGGIPQRIEYALKELFPGWQLYFQDTPDGRIVMKVKESDVDFYPPSLPDGFFRLLLILTAVELRPKILIIDEIETSLHMRILQYLIDTLKSIESTVILATHSPLVVDLSQPEDLAICTKENYETHIRRIKDVGEVRKKLLELNVSLSDSWLSENL